MRVIILLLTALFATTAHATPPQVVSVSETLLGINDTHLFVLRRMDDNMGSHYPVQTDVVLIARNRETNLDDQIWPVMRMIDHGVSFVEFGYEVRVEPLALKDRVNPFDILLWRKARPLLDAEQFDPAFRGTKISRAKDRLALVSDTGLFQLQDTMVAQRLTSSLNATRTALPAYFIEGGERGFDMLRDVQVDPAQDCDYDGFYTFSEQIGDDYAEFWLTRFTCENDEIMADISMYFLIPKAP